MEMLQLIVSSTSSSRILRVLADLCRSSRCATTATGTSYGQAPPSSTYLGGSFSTPLILTRFSRLAPSHLGVPVKLTEALLPNRP